MATICELPMIKLPLSHISQIFPVVIFSPPCTHAGGAAGGRVVHPPPSSRIEETANLAAKLIF